ncbi:DUF4349 domain-containing protein [Microbispora sp. H11081]|uniref:DUF4349 domain-containing protein n=1 Tax=Microbispora sp. H11081 TaxID=2729107 RepID=UPI0014757229|nr:DUF4349 domain-containing protein [Microbispora sp. H11081]
MKRIRYSATALAAVAFLLTGCGGSADLSSGGAADSAPAPAAQAAEPATARAQDQSAERGSDADGGSGGQRKLRIDPTERAIIYQAEVTVEAKDVTAAADRAKAIVTGAGGYVAEERGEYASRGDLSVLTFKVPPARYADVLAQLGRDLGKRRSMRQNAQDVTEEVADVASRVKSAEATLGQFRTLLTKANKIGEILEIEREIANREAELESLQARQKALEAQTGMATVTLTLVLPPERSATNTGKEDPSGFLGGLRTGWNALTTSTVVALTVLGALLPWLVVAALVWLAVRTVVRRMRRRTGPPPGAVSPGAVPPGPVPPGAMPPGAMPPGPVPQGHGPGSPVGAPVPVAPHGPGGEPTGPPVTRSPDSDDAP